MIEVENLSKSYASRKAIQNISFHIDDGEIVGLLGLNGAGKSTILKILATYLAPSSGRARLGGFSIADESEDVRRLIGFLPDRAPLYDEMSVRGYLEYVAKLKNVPRSEVPARVDEAIAKTNLQTVTDLRLDALSHGFRQRVGIAQALVHNPRVLILDEPINGLDPVQIVEMRDLILSLKGRHTVILSSHILSEITRTCDRILVIDRGQLVAEGSEAELSRRLTRHTHFELEVGGDGERAKANVLKVAGVRTVDLSKKGETQKLFVEANEDTRAAVARAVVESGADLLGLKKTDEGLEGLFLKLIQAE